jgi:hypothetical protein
VIRERAYPTLERLGDEYEWWAEEWPDFSEYCRRTAPHKPLPIGRVVYKNFKNLRRGAWSEPLII